jgi:hypothetical protein
MKHLLRWLIVASLGTIAAIAFARANGAPASRTGAPATGGLAAESSCLNCHSGNTLNSGGSVTVLGVPALFHGGHTYRLTVHLVSSQTTGSSTRNWGFQLTAVDTANGQGAGTFAVVSAAQTAIISGSSTFSTRRYVDQLSGGTQDGAGSPVEWQVDWTAPTAGATRVRFFVAGLAADGDGSESGDWVYTGTAAATDTVTAAIPRTWGSVKSEYLR